jgi:hypothetical protein
MRVKKLSLLSTALVVFGVLAPLTSSFAWTPSRQWLWCGATDSVVSCPPIVINLTDDNGNGAIDACDHPEVAFITDGGRLIVVDGTTGQERFVMDEGLADAGLAAADLVGDEVPELIAIKPVADSFFQIVAFDTTGTQVVTGDTVLIGFNNANWLTISVADLNKDDTPEILVGSIVFAGNTGDLLWQGSGGQGEFQAHRGSYSSTGVNLNSDDSLEVLAGNTAYRWGGRNLWQYVTPDSDYVDGASAVGNFDTDSFPEVVFVSKTWTIYLLDEVESSSPVLLDSYYFPGGEINTSVAFPALGQLDTDSEPEVAEMNGDSLYAFDYTGGEWVKMWALNIDDWSPTKSGLSMADLDGDGYDEIVYRDCDTLRIVDHSGNVVWQTPISSGTSMDYPTIADIDGDNEMEFVVPGSDSGTNRGVSAFECTGNWVDGRRVWNDYTYHVTNINEDGSVPVAQDKCWLTDNSFLAQENRCVLCGTEVVGDWTIETVKSEVSGFYNSIGLWQGHYPFISFYVDSGQGKGLWYAHKHPYPRCGTYPEWSALPVDTTRDTGGWTSIVLHPDDSASVFMSNCDFDSNDVVVHQAPGPGCVIAMNKNVVDSAGTLGTFGTDMATDTTESPWLQCVVYYDETNGDLEYAEKGPNDSVWSRVTIDRDGDVGKYPAIAIDDDGRRHVSYYDATNGWLKYAICGSGCGSSPANWTVDFADSARDSVVGLFTEIALDASDYPHISYIDSTNKSLKHARFTPSGWNTHTVEDESSPQDLIASTSIAVDKSGTPQIHISYTDRYEKTLKYARSTDGGDTWSTLTIPDPWDDVGLWNSIVLGAGDTLHISYSASDSLCDFKALKYTRGKP